VVRSNIKLKNINCRKRKLLRVFSFLIIILFSAFAESKYLNLTDATEKKKTVISGVLNPPSISVNGSEIPQKAATYSALLINNQEVKMNSTGGLQTFYEVVEGDQLLLQWKTPKKTLVNILEFAYPAVISMELKHTDFVLKFNDQTKKATYDGEPLNINDPKIKIPSTLTWLETPHTLELFSDQDIGRLYNLDFRKYKEDLLTMASWTLSIGDAQFQGNNRPSTVGASSRILNEKNYSHEIFAGVAHTSYVVGANTSWAGEVEQRTVELKYKYGFNPFHTNSGDFNYRRVTVGLHASLINYNRKSDYAMSWMDGYNETSVDTWFYQGGYFVRWEPLQIGNFGFSLSIDHRNFRSQSSIRSDSTIKGFGLSYYFDPAILKRIISRQPLEF
jgi:hypothetical protein